MASDNEACCESDPNFAVICGFLEKFGVTCGLANIDFLDLQDMLENNQEVPQELVDLHIKLLRKARKSVSSERWERAIIKFCHGFCSQDAWEIERFGYKKARLSSKLRILKELLEMQFDYNAKFKNEINKLSADELRTQPLGRDRHGHVYWFQSDNSCQIRVYKEDPDEETWSLVAKDRDGLVGLITHLNDGQETVVNEDSNSLESEKPVVDTGQTDSNSNSTSSNCKPDQANTEENQIEAKEENSKEDLQNDIEDSTQMDAEIIKLGKIKLKNKRIPITADMDKTNEIDKVKVSEVVNNSNDDLNEQEAVKSDSNLDMEEKDKSFPEAAASPSKTGISIRIKPISELISTSTGTEVNKKVEITGVKEKYIRTDSTSSSSVHHRKAVDSAGFDVHANYLKRPIEEEEDVDEPSYIKRPRLDRPTLLGNKKKKSYSEEEDDDDEEDEVSDEIEEPLMLVTGEGSGRDNECGNCKIPESTRTETSPIVEEAIEESVMYFYGEGYGHECETGNEDNSNKQDSKEQSNSTSETDKADTIDSINDNKPSSSFDESSCLVKTSPKVEFKLGTIIDVRTNSLMSCARDPNKKSRWDIGRPDESLSNESQVSILTCNNSSEVYPELETLSSQSSTDDKSMNLCEKEFTRGKDGDVIDKEENSGSYLSENTNNSDEGIDNTPVTPKKSMFFFGPGCLQFKPTISPLKSTVFTNQQETVNSKETSEDIEEQNKIEETISEERSEKKVEESITESSEVAKHEQDITNRLDTQKQVRTADTAVSNKDLSSHTSIHDNNLLVQQNCKTNKNLMTEMSEDNMSDIVSSNIHVFSTSDIPNPSEDNLNNIAKGTSLDKNVSCDISNVNLDQSDENEIIKQENALQDTLDQNKISNKIDSLPSSSIPANHHVPKTFASSDAKLEDIKECNQSNNKTNMNQKFIDVPTDKSCEADSVINVKNYKEESLPVKKEASDSTCTSEDKPKNKVEDTEMETVDKTDSLDLNMKSVEHLELNVTAPVVESCYISQQEGRKESVRSPSRDPNMNNSIISTSNQNQNVSGSILTETDEKVESILEVQKKESNLQDISKKTSDFNEILVTNVEVKSRDIKCNSEKTVESEFSVKTLDNRTIQEDVSINAKELLNEVMTSFSSVEKCDKTKTVDNVKITSENEESLTSATNKRSESTEETLNSSNQEMLESMPPEEKLSLDGTDNITHKCDINTKSVTEEVSKTAVSAENQPDDKLCSSSIINENESSKSNDITTSERTKEERLNDNKSSSFDISQKQNIQTSATVDSVIDLKPSPIKNDSDQVALNLSKKNKTEEQISKNTPNDILHTVQVKNADVSKKIEKLDKDKTDSKLDAQISEVPNFDQKSSLRNKIEVDLKKSIKEKSAINIKEVMTNATSILPSNENKSRADSDKISLADILSTSEKVPVFAVKGISDSVGSFASSKSIASDSNLSISKSTEVKAGGENTKIVSNDKIDAEKITKSNSEDSSETKHIESKEVSKNNEVLENTEENIKKPNKRSSSITSKKSGIKETPKPIVLLDSIRLDKKSEKSNRFNKTATSATTTSKKSSEANRKTTSIDKLSTEIENKKSAKSSAGKTKNLTNTDCNSLKTENEKTDLSKGSTSDQTKTVSTDEPITNRRSTRRTRNSNVEKVDLSIDETSSNNKVLTPTNKPENNSSQVVSKRTRKSVSEKNEDTVVENSTPELEKTDDKSSTDDAEIPQGKGKSSRRHKTPKESKEVTNVQSTSEEINTDIEQQNTENENEEQKLKSRGKSNSRGNSAAKTRSQTRSESNKEDSKKNEVLTVDLEDIEEQIIRTEIRPSKKLKLSDAVEITVVDKNKRTVTTEKMKDSEKESNEGDKKAPPRTRRSLRSNQQSNVDQNKTVKETEDDKSEVEKQKNSKQTEDDLIPVDEPKCVQKKVPLLTSVDADKLKAQNEDDIESDVNKKTVASPDSVHSGGAFDDEPGESSNDDAIKEVVDNVEEDAKDAPELVDESPMTMSSFKLDTEDVSVVRVTRKRAAQQSVDALRETRNQDKINRSEKKDEVDNKRPKLKKRSVDRNLRRSIEEQKLKEVSSSEDDNNDKNEDQTSSKPDNVKKSKNIAKRRVSTRSTRATESPIPSSDPQSEASRTDASNTPSSATQRKPRKQKKTLLGLEISEETENLLKGDTPVGVRQSRRIAQLKIKEEAERRKLEEVTLQELKEEQRKRKGKKNEDKDYKMDKRKRNKNVPTEDETTGDAESDEKKKRKRKRKHWNPTKQFDIFKAWKSSSGSSSSEVEDEEEEIEEDDENQIVLRSDHEFSPESDLEEGGEVQPLKRARTARKESDAEEEVDDCACQKCGQKDHPEWILLCDSCDSGWHCSCLRPALLVIPEGDWFCPPCQHITLVKNLETQLNEYDKKLNKREMETRRKERLAYVGISLDNVLPSKESDEHRNKQRHQQDREKESSREDQESDDEEDDESASDDSDSESETSSSSESDSEPIYQLRERRQAHSYRFNDYDELINSAIQDELDAVKGAGNQGRGKDIATIVNAEKEEEALCLKNETEATVVKTDDVAESNSNVAPSDSAVESANACLAPDELLPPVVPLDYESKPIENDSDDEVIRPVKKIIGKKKHRKLNSLDVSSEDDAESDEDFKGSSTSDSEEDFEDEEYSGSDSSDDTRRGKRRKDFGPVRRSTRARISRYDRDFINDDSESEDKQAPRRKKTRSIWDESESEESDRSWGKRKRKAAKSKRRRPSTGKVKKSKKKKKKRSGDDSDPEVFRKRPNIKFGGLNDDEEVGRRTRGKKINYLEALGTDSEEEMRRKPPRIEESEEEYNVHEDEEFQKHLENDKDSDESGVENVLQDIAAMPKVKPRGRGKAGLKIPRRPKDAPPPEFPPMIPDLSQPPIHPSPSIMDPSILQPLGPPTQLPIQSQLLDTSLVQDSELLDIDDELDPIEQINKNVEQMNEQEMEKMMEEEDYANKQLQLIALQIEKEKKRKEREAKRLEQLMEQKEQKIPKKRGRKPKNQMLNTSTDVIPPTPFNETSSVLINSVMTNNAELSEPPGVSLPMFSEIAPVLNADGTLKKRRGRGKGKKTLAAEAAALAAANKDGLEMDLGPEGPTSSGSNTVSPAPDSPLHGSKLGIAAPPQPFSQSQPTPSVITRMLQSQPGQGGFPIGGSKYFGGVPGDPPLGPPPVSGAYHQGTGGPRGPIPGPYQQPPPGMAHYPVVRSGPTPPHRLHSPGPPGLPPMYHSHRSLDPSPSGGGPINVSTANRDRHSPAIVPPASSSPLSKGDPTPPPPPYTTRPQVGHFPPGSVSSGPSLTAAGPRHVAMVPPHLQQHRPSNMSPYHPGVPPNYHYGSYPPPPPLNADEGQPPPVYPNPPYSEPYPNEGGPPVQPSESNSSTKPFDEETGGEFVGLVSYFSSQREDDLDT